MKKSIIISAIIVLFLLGIVIGAILIKNSAEAKEEKVEIAEQNDEEIYDECTEEYESMNQENTLIEETSSESEKISPNCSIVFRRYYNECGHTI